MDEVAKLAVDVGMLNAEFGRESSASIVIDNLSVEEIRSLIKKVAFQAAASPVTLKSVDVGSDILSRLGGPSHFFDAARNEDGIIIGGTAEAGKIIFSFAL